MIAQVVFDLPVEGPFDYLVPEDLVAQISPGMRVRVSFAGRQRMGFVIGILEKSAVDKLKTLQSLSEKTASLNSLDLGFAKEFCAYYGCSMGEALAAILRNRNGQEPSRRRERKPRLSLWVCRPDVYGEKIKAVMDGYGDGVGKGRFLVLVPDAFRMRTLSLQLGALSKAAAGQEVPKLGTRSLVFECDGRYDCVIMVDDEDASYKEEQTPMYETRQVLLSRSRVYGFDVAFVGISPSVELMALVGEGHVEQSAKEPLQLPSMRPVDLSNYKFTPGLLSVPVREAVDASLKAAKTSLLVLNRKGSYRLTKCVDCGEVLKCGRCDSPLIYSRSAGKFLCRHCAYTAAGDTVCPKCHKASWRSQGIGVEQLQSELKKLFPQARILSFERGAKFEELAAVWQQGRFDILIATRAVLRFQGMRPVGLAAFIDFDAEVNRLDSRSAFNAFSLALHVASMTEQKVFIQTRSMGHYAVEKLAHGDIQGFYDEELKLRKEFGFSPFRHWVRITWRAKSEKSASEAALQVYNILIKAIPDECQVTPPLADEVGRKRDQFRFNVMVQAREVQEAIALIREALAQTKRQSRVITTLNVDP